MSRDAPVRRGIWTEDQDFLDLPPHAKLLYFWGFTNDHFHLSGLYRVARSVMGTETGLTARQLEAALGDVSRPGMMLYEAGAVWVASAIKNCPWQSPNSAKSIRRVVRSFAEDHPLRVALLRRYRGWPWLGGALDDLSVPDGFAEPKTEGSSEGLGTPLQGVHNNNSSFEPSEFVEWLEHHVGVTGYSAPKPGTAARRDLAASFQARRDEGYELADLKLATVGAHANDFRRENGYDRASSVLRPKKVHDLVEAGRRAGVPANDLSKYDRAAGL